MRPNLILDSSNRPSLPRNQKGDRAYLQKINMKHTLNRQRSLEMACLSQLTYVAYNQGLEVVRDILKSGCSPLVRQYETIEFIQAPRALISTSDFACCGLALSAPNEIAIAIRGTENLDDYFLNLLAESNSQGIHSGFDTFVERFWEQLQEFILREYNSRKDIFITGHSLGGAAATLITKRLQKSGLKLIDPYVLETYTFGAPPVSTEEFILDTPLYRFRNAGDFIPHLPEIIAVAIKRIPGLRGAIANWKPGLLETLSNYSHLEAEYLIENDYSCRQLDEPDISKIWQQDVNDAVDASGSSAQQQADGFSVGECLKTLIDIPDEGMNIARVRSFTDADQATLKA